MDLLVLGANGLLGSNVAARAAQRGHTVTGAYHSTAPELDVATAKLDITDSERFETLCSETDADAVINCAAMTDVDGCESEPERAVEVNGAAPERLAKVAVDAGAPFVHVSTDYVFDGQSTERYDESDEPAPIQAYGESKLRGERRVREADSSALIPRLSFVYGRHAGTQQLEGFPCWVLDRLADGESVPAFVDQHVTPTRAGQAAAVILDLLATEASGIIHVACRTCTTPYKFARTIAQLQGKSLDLIKEGQLADVDRPADRPANTCLDVSRVEELLGLEQPTLRVDLESIL